MKTLLIIIALSAVAFASGVGTGWAMERSSHDPHFVNHELVYATCQLSRTGDLQTEQECADVQYDNQIEYLCKDASTSPDNECWTEDNNELERY